MESYDRTTEFIFEVMGSYFVGFFYNVLYKKSYDKFHEGGARTLTDAFKANVCFYMQGVAKNNVLYIKVIKGLLSYYHRYTSYNIITLPQFEDRVLKQFIPPQYYRDFSESDKDRHMALIIQGIVKDFSMAILNPENGFLKIIIDNHNVSKLNLRILQDKIVEIMGVKREQYYTMFAQSSIKTISDDQTNVITELKTLLRKYEQRNKALEAEKASCKKIMQKMLGRIKELENSSYYSTPSEQSNKKSLYNQSYKSPPKSPPKSPLSEEIYMSDKKQLDVSPQQSPQHSPKESVDEDLFNWNNLSNEEESE